MEAAARGVEARATDSHIYGMAQFLGNKDGPNDNFAEALPCGTQQRERCCGRSCGHKAQGADEDAHKQEE